jgi:pilus assembly protein CpaF
LNGNRSYQFDPRAKGEAQRNGSGDDARMKREVRERVHRRLLAEVNPAMGISNSGEIHRALERIYAEVMTEMALPLSRSERVELYEQVVADILALGPLEPLLRDETVTEILVNGPELVFVERRGILEETNLRFANNEEVMRIIERIVAPLGRRIDESSPMVDARLPDGSRVNIIIPPLSLVGPCISIRKFAKTALNKEDFLRLNTLTREMVDFLDICVRARLNVVVSGGTSTGKTTFLNMLSSFIPNKERILTIEDAAELKLQQRHVVKLEARPPNVEGRGQITIRQLVMNALRMRPDRIVVGEVRGGEALDMLQAMNTGHDGSLTTVHSNSARDTLHRVETMVLMAGMELPLRAIREQIAAAFDLVVHLERLADGTRRVVQISEVQGMEGEIIVMQDIFRFVQTGAGEGRVEGHFTAMGVRPKFMETLENAGHTVSPAIFTPTPQNKRRW